MKPFSYQIDRHARKRGFVMYFAAGSIVMLLGCAALAVDYGVLVNDKNHLQRVCDAAALAGASKLPDTDQATSIARLVAGQNRFVASATQDITYTFTDNNRRIRVEAVRRRSLFFARVLGQQIGVVRARAVATAFGTTPSIAPIGITDTTYNQQNPIVSGRRRTYDTQPSPPFTITLIDHKKESFNAGEFILFDLRDAMNKSAPHMQRQLEGTDAINVTINDIGAVEETEATALNATSQAQFLFDGMTTRFQAAAAAPWFDIDSTKGTNYADYAGQHFNQVFNGSEPLGSGNPFTDNPRVMSLIVTRETTSATSGSLNAPILDLAPVYVTKMTRVTSRIVTLEYRYLPVSMGGGGKTSLID